MSLQAGTSSRVMVGVGAAGNSSLQQRRASRSSQTDATEAREFRARLGSIASLPYAAAHAIVEDEEEEEEDHKHGNCSRGYSKNSDDDESRPTTPPPPLPPPLVDTSYPPMEMHRASTSSIAATTLTEQLPPMDRGAEAWRFLACGFVVWCMVWGVAYSYGSFQDYHEHNHASPFYGSSVTSISAVGTLVIGCSHFVPLLLRGFLATFPHLHRKLVAASLVLSALSLLIGSFSTHITMLIVFQGILFGITSGVLLTPVVLYLPQWFDRKRGFATSCIFMGSGVGGVVFPLIINALLTNVGFAWTMRTWSLAQLLITGTALYFVKPRTPTPTTRVKTAVGLSSGRVELARSLLPGDLSALLHPVALIYFLVIIFQAFGWYIVSLYIATYSTALGFSSTISTGILSAFNAAAIIGYMVTGPAIDKVSATLAMAISSALCGVFALCLLGFATSLPLVLVFVLSFGAAGGGFGCYITPIARHVALVSKSDNSLQFLCWMFIRGTAAVAGPLIGSALYRPNVTTPNVQPGEYGINGFGRLIVFVGSSMGLAAIAAVAAFAYRKYT